ncbi:MAG TPA: immunoglobulin domain-containing protein [Verrucomicrobiae bacterium]|nr:immunoglobulin domain-containing protein [Verrucomicrobiae bacterium]
MVLKLGSAGHLLLDGNTSWDAVAGQALSAWNSYINQIQFVPSTQSPGAGSQGDQVNQAFFSSTIYGQSFGDALAVTGTWRSGNTMTESDVLFNTAYSWDSYRGNLRFSGGQEVPDFFRVALHEFGHVLGLGHPDQAGQTVSAIMNSVDSNLDRLASDDISGATWLYYRAPPAITTQPQSKTARIGDTVAFGVSASGAQPMVYQWRRNGTVIPGATGGSYIIPNVQANHAGNYTVFVGNAVGSAISATAVLTINQAPSTSQLRLFSINNGDPTVREWDASNGAFLGDVAILNDNNGTFSNISDIEFDGHYFYGIANNGPWILRFDVTGFYLDSITLLEGTGNPVSQAQSGLAADGQYFYTIAPNDPRIRRFDRAGHYIGDAAVLALAQSGLTKDGLTFLTIAAGDPRIRRFDLAGNFMGDVIGFNRSGVSDVNNTGIALYQIPAAPKITVQPVNASVVPGGNVVFSVGASGTAPLSYQWFRNNWAIAGATGATHTINSVQTADAGAYKVWVRNSLGTVVSAVATLTVDGIKPLVVISSPTPGARLTNSSVALTGTASDNIRVATVEWRLENSQGIGSYHPAIGTSNWSAIVAGLTPGVNTVQARARDTVGNWSAETTSWFNYVVLSPLTVGINGLGSITPNLNGQQLEIGKAYKLTALPAPGYALSNWTGGVVTNSANVSFLMQSNLTLTANFVPNPFVRVGGTYYGLFYETNGTRHGASGDFKLRLTARGKYTTTLRLAGRRYAASGNLNLEGGATNVILRPGISSLTTVWAVDLHGLDQITGSVSDGQWLAPLLGDRALFHASTNPAPLAARYTLVVPGSRADPAEPGGHGWGTLRVSKGGVGLLAGALSDGTRFTQKAPLSKNGAWPLYAPLYQLQGSVLGWIQFDPNAAAADLTGLIDWCKPAMPTAIYYPAGFTNQTQLRGSRYVPPAYSTNRVLALTNGVVVMGGGNLSQSWTNDIVLGVNNRVTNTGPNKLTATLAPGTGLFKGTFLDTNTSRTMTFSGALLQKSTNGAGYCLGTNLSAAVVIEAR